MSKLTNSLCTTVSTSLLKVFFIIYIYIIIYIRFHLGYLLVLLWFGFGFILVTFWFWFGFFLVSGRGFYNYYLLFIIYSFFFLFFYVLWSACGFFVICLSFVVFYSVFLRFQHLKKSLIFQGFPRFTSLFFSLFIACHFPVICLWFFCVFFTLNLWGDLIGRGVDLFSPLRESSRGKDIKKSCCHKSNRKKGDEVAICDSIADTLNDSFTVDLLPSCGFWPYKRQQEIQRIFPP